MSEKDTVSLKGPHNNVRLFAIGLPSVPVHRITIGLISIARLAI